MQRGKIYNRERAQQIKDYSGLCLGNITPTDIDGFIEYRDRAFIWIETKLNGNDMPYGQQLAYERLVRVAQKDRPSIYFVTTHDTPSDEDIDMAATLVSKWYYKGRWKNGKVITLGQAVKLFIKQEVAQ